MKRILFLLLWVFGSMPSAFAFLTDQDPKNVFDLIQQAPQIVAGEVRSVKAASEQNSSIIYDFNVSENLAGAPTEKRVQVLQEKIFPNEPMLLQKSQTAIILLSNLPSYTAYEDLRKQGVQSRFFGGKVGVLPLTEQNRQEILNLVKTVAAWGGQTGSSNLSAKSKVFVQALSSTMSEIREDAALSLEKMALAPSSLSQEDLNTIGQNLTSPYLSRQAKLALVKVLEKVRAVDNLQKVLPTASGGIKGAVAQALNDLGVSRPMQDWIEDFKKSDDADKSRFINFIVKNPTKESELFIQQYLVSPAPVKIKSQWIQAMGQTPANPVYEKILLANLENPEDAVVVQTMLALVKMNSPEGVTRIIAKTESGSELVRSTAVFALRQSQDPRAVKIVREKFEDEGASHTH